MNNWENAIELETMEDVNYTCVSSESLEITLPDSRLPLDDVVRERPSEPLRQRSPEEIAQLEDHPLFI